MNDLSRRDALAAVAAVGAAAFATGSASAGALKTGKMTINSSKEFGGASHTFTNDVPDLDAVNFNDKAESIHVEKGTWMLFENQKYEGNALTVNAHGGPNGDGKYPTKRYFHGMWGVSSCKCVSSEG